MTTYRNAIITVISESGDGLSNDSLVKTSWLKFRDSMTAADNFAKITLIGR